MHEQLRRLAAGQAEERRLEAGLVFRNGRLLQVEIARQEGISRQGQEFENGRRGLAGKNGRLKSRGWPRVTPTVARTALDFGEITVHASLQKEHWSLVRIRNFIGRRFAMRDPTASAPTKIRDGVGRCWFLQSKAAKVTKN